MRTLRRLLLVLFACVFAPVALAEEQINSFDVEIVVATDGDIEVTETITVTSEGFAIQRGIFRDLPRYYESDGARLPYGYNLLSVRRDGATEPATTETVDNAWRIRIGEETVFLDPGLHTYEIRYRVKNQVRYFDDYDEIYWNVTGTYWNFPILETRATIVLPPGAEVIQTAAYTGYQNVAGRDFVYTTEGDRHIFAAARALQPREGLTVAVGVAKGLIDPPSRMDLGWLWWQRNGSLVILLGSLTGLFWFYVRSFERVGRDPPKGPVFPRYEPPAGYSPAAAHHIYHRGLRSHGALIATLMRLAVRGRLTIDASDKKLTELTWTPEGGDVAGLTAEETALERTLFRGRATRTLGEKYDAGFTAAYTTFRKALSHRYGPDYFRWNAGYTIAGLALTVLGLVLAVQQAAMWTVWHTAGVLGLAGLNLLFIYLMPAPTPRGQRVRVEIEGFRLYMETAEKLQLNAVKVGGDAPPPITRDRYETFLPYAVALGVEEPWTRHFERLVPQEADSYNPGWARFRSNAGRSLSRLNASLVAGMSSGVSSSLPQSSGSSGSGGGGSSGGGGGGGGGGGW